MIILILVFNKRRTTQRASSSRDSQGRHSSRPSTESSLDVPCGACDQKIDKGTSPRWGIKYGGNPLSMPVLPLYGTHPMVAPWYHAAAGCGASFVRYSDLPPEHLVARTCQVPVKKAKMAQTMTTRGQRFASCVEDLPNQHGKIRQEGSNDCGARASRKGI
jgi:hypothetical protein